MKDQKPKAKESPNITIDKSLMEEFRTRIVTLIFEEYKMCATHVENVTEYNNELNMMVNKNAINQFYFIFYF